jgi:hypothetical protein
MSIEQALARTWIGTVVAAALASAELTVARDGEKVICEDNDGWRRGEQAAGTTPSIHTPLTVSTPRMYCVYV